MLFAKDCGVWWSRRSALGTLARCLASSVNGAPISEILCKAARLLAFFSARSEALSWRDAIRLFVGNAERKLRGLSAQWLSLWPAKTRRARKKSGLERPLRLQQRQEIQGKETPHSCGQIRVSGVTEAIDCGTNQGLAQPLPSPCAGLVTS